MTDACDIARRFEQLETQWMSFSKKSAKLERDKDTLEKSTTSLYRNQLSKYAASSAASSYSNPLFTNHSTAKPGHTVGDKASLFSGRTCNSYAGFGMKADATPVSCFRHREASAADISSSDGKDGPSSSLLSPAATVLDAACHNTEKASMYGQESSPSETVVPRANVPTSIWDKPRLCLEGQATCEAPELGSEKYGSCASSVFRHNFRKKGGHRREVQSSLNPPEIPGVECARQPTSKAIGDDLRECDTEFIESLQPLKYSVVYPSGNGPSQLNLSSLDFVQSSDAHGHQSRSPPSAPQTSATDADVQLFSLSDHDGVSDRNISWRVHGGRGVLTEGSLKMDSNPSKLISEEEVRLPEGIFGQNLTETSSKDGNLLTLEVQIDQKNVVDSDLGKVGERFEKVNWELRLSKREAALRIAEEKLSEQEYSISQARLAASRSEGSLRQREQDAQLDSEKQKNDLEESLKSIITGKTVLKKLCTGLKDVLWQLELKEKVLQSTWLELKNSVDTESVFGDHSFGFEPESSQLDTRRATFDGISFLVADRKREEWCSIVIGICERLVTYMNRESHLQKWAAVLEREGMRLGKMTKEIVNAKEAAREQCARSEDMMQCAEEQAACIDSERVKLAMERDNLILWISHLQERRKSVAECEMEAAKSLAEFQKKAADLFVHESNVDERALQVSALQEELRVTSQRLQDDQVFINREKHKVLEKMRQVAGRDRELESKTSVMKQLQDDLNAKAEELETDRVDKKRKEVLLSALHEREERLNARERSVREIQKDLEQKVAAVEERTNIVNDREKLLTDLQLHMEIERSNMHELRIGLEKEKVRLQEAEEAVVEAHCTKRSAEEAWARTAQERRESLRLGEDRLKQWDNELRIKEKEIQGQQKMLQEIVIHAREEQEHTEALHAKLVEEQDSWTNELKAKQENLSRRNKVLDAKEEEINNDLARLTEERNVALEDMKRLAEMEARAWSAERDLQTKHDEHLKEVMNHASEYNSQVEDLASAKREVKKEFEEVRARKQELKIWQREAEETLQNRIASFIKGKEELTAQIKELKKLQTDIEQAGSQIIDRVAELDLASTRLECQRYKVENSKKKLEALADKLATHQEVLKRRECDFLTQESKLVAIQNGLKRMATEAASREKSLRCREQAVIDSENDLHDVEVRLASEREDLEKMVAEVEQHAVELREGTASVEEVSCSRTRNEHMMEEQRCKERELEELGKEAKCLEKHAETTSKQDMQVKERLLRSVGFEAMSEEVEKGWEQEQLNTTKLEIQKRAVLDEVQWQMHSDHDAVKRKRVKNIGELSAREALPEACEPALIEDQFQYVEEKHKAAEAIPAVIAKREHRFKLQQHEFSGMEVIDSDKMRHRGLSHELHERQVAVVKGSTGYEEHAPLLEMQLSGIEVSAGLANWVSRLDGREAHFDYQQSLDHKRMDRDMGNRLNVMEEALQKEASKISQERANLKLQQQDLEETKKAVEEVKLSLKAQLKTAKQMVADATLTAQNASREREALEEERKRLAQDRKDAEASVALKEKELAIETIQLETTKSSLKQVKVNGMGMIHQHGVEAMCAEHAKGGSCSAHWDATTSSVLKQQNAKAMEIIQQARRKAVNADYSEIGSSTAHWDSSLLHFGSQCEVSCKVSEKEINPSAVNTNVGEGVEGSMLYEVPGEEHIQHHHSGVNGAFKANACLKDPENQMQWNETREGRDSEGYIRKVNDRDLTFEGSSNSTIHIAEHETPFSAPGGGLLSIGESGDYGEEFAKKMHADSELANHASPDSECRDAFDPKSSSINVTYNRITPEKMSDNEWPLHLLEVKGVPSRKRLENVMTSLLHARQASRSRLKRTEIALLALSPSSGCITQVQQALDALSARLSLMEQIEEGLGSHLRNTYKTELPESEILLVDKVQLLSRMEEQQSVRAEWEEDMQRQLETISMLQAATSTSPNFCTPPRDPNQGLLPASDRQNHSSIVFQDGGKGHDSHEILGSIGTTGATSSTDDGGEVTRPSIQYPNVKRINVHEPRGGFDPNGTFNSYFVAYEYMKNPADLHSTGLEPHGSDSHGRGAQRKLLVSPPHVTFT